MAEIDSEMLRVKNDENLVKSREHMTPKNSELNENNSKIDLGNYKKNDDAINLDDALVDNRKNNQGSSDIDKMWKSLVKCDDDDNDEKKIVEKMVNDIATGLIDEENLELGENIISNDEELDLDLAEPTPEVMEYAKRELGETDEVKCQTLQELRDMIY
ncbi:hypothetical protein PV326_005477, partial [Microctonus aethiopoides]